MNLFKKNFKMSEFNKTPTKINGKIEIDSQEFSEMQIYAAIGRFVKEFEFLTTMIRNFLKPCLLKLEWPKRKINSHFAKKSTGQLITLLKKYKKAFPDDPKGQEVLANFTSVLIKINEGRIQLLHGFHMGDHEKNAFITIKDWEREKGQLEKVILEHTPQQLEQWEKVMAMMSNELWLAMKNVKNGKSIHKSLLTGNLKDSSLPELGNKDF